MTVQEQAPAPRKNDGVFVFLYDEGTETKLSVSEIAGYLREQLPRAQVDARGEFVGHHTTNERLDGLALALARIKVTDPTRQLADRKPLFGEVNFERERLHAGNRGAFGVIYDGLEVQAAMRGLLLREEASRTHAHIIFSNRLLATWEQSDLRYHLRVIVGGSPALISTSGAVEAPAKPREFYQAKEQLGADPLVYERIKAEFAGRFLDHDDERLTEVLKGYALQVVLYQFTGQGFCANPACRLYNAHWQEEMLRAQLDGIVCGKHARLLASLRER